MSTLSHDQRRERRKAIAEHAKEHGGPEAARKFGVSIRTVHNSLQEHGATGLPVHRNRNVELRREAAILANKEGVQAAVEKYNVAGGTLRSYLKEFGLKPAVGSGALANRNSRTLRILHALQTTSKNGAEIGRELSVTDQAVSLVYQTAKQIGFTFPHRDKA